MRYGDWKLQDLMTFHIIGQPGVFMRRAVLEQAGYLDLSYNYLLDVQLWLRMAAIAEPFYVPGAVWAAARMHSDAKNKLWAGAHRLNAFYLVEAGQYRQALRSYAKMLRLAPATSKGTFKRMGFAALGALGAQNLRQSYANWRLKHYQKRLEK